MKSIIIGFALLISLNALVYAQSEKAIISVKGNASFSVAPTETGISILLESSEMTYSDAISGLIDRVKILNKNLENAGVLSDEKFTEGFNIRKNIVYENSRQNFKGYVASQSVFVRIKLDMERLIKIINAITLNNANPEINISFTIDKKTLNEKKKLLLKLAVQDAKEKAEIIAKESAYEIVGIKRINYGIEQPVIMRNSYDMMATAKMERAEFSSGDMNAPSNIILSDMVDIEYYISK
jgi:uncharacterized protein YggE